MSELERVKSKPNRLGRGISSLLGENTQTAETDVKAENPEKKTEQIEIKTNPGDRVENLAIEKVERNPEQPRRIFDQEALKELSNSITTQGIIQPIIVKEVGAGRYQIIAGERRWRAAQLAGLHTVPCVVKRADHQQSLEMALVENIQRRDLNALEEAKAYRNLMDKFKLTQQQVADKVGKDRATVANLLRVLQLPENVQGLIADGSLSLGQAKVLLSLSNSETIPELARACVEKKLSVRAVERLVEKYNSTTGKIEPSETANLQQGLVEKTREDLQKSLGSRVEIEYSEGRGKVSLYFYDNEQFNELIARIQRPIQK